MPYKYIGRKHDFVGKTFWEIVGNLKDFGVGRIIVRSRMERYPEPCYMKILKVEPLPNPENPTYDDVRKVRVLVEKTFRGKTFPKPVLIESASYKTDYRLIPKDEEAKYCKKVDIPSDGRVFPKTMEFPPLMKELIIREMKAQGKSITEEPRLEIVYRNQYRIAEDGEKPNVEVPIGLGKTVAPRLYEGVKLN